MHPWRLRAQPRWITCFLYHSFSIPGRVWFDFFHLLCSVIHCSLLFHVLALLYFIPIWIVRLFSTQECYVTHSKVISYCCSFNELILLYNIDIPYILPLLFDYRVIVLCIYKSILLFIYLRFTPKCDWCSLGLLFHYDRNCCFYTTVINNCYVKTQITVSSIEKCCV